MSLWSKWEGKIEPNSQKKEKIKIYSNDLLYVYLNRYLSDYLTLLLFVNNSKSIIRLKRVKLIDYLSLKNK
jgi:hypothetical protein